MRPIIGITSDVVDPGGDRLLKADCSLAYARAIAAAGGVAVLLPALMEQIAEHLELCDAFVLTGGDDPRTEAFGVPTHAQAKPMHVERQAYELRLLAALEEAKPAAPVLGICLGMQMMALHGGGRLNQHLPETLATAGVHRGVHEIRATPLQPGPLTLCRGEVWSNHHQAVEDPADLVVTARSPDGVIEALWNPARVFCCGVQWHPERTVHLGLGAGIFEQVVGAARAFPGRRRA